MHIYIYIYIYIYLYTYTFIYLYTYIVVHIYTYTHICVARRTVLFLLQFAYYLGLMVCLYDIVLAHMIICI